MIFCMVGDRVYILCLEACIYIYLEDHVHEEPESVLAGVLAGDVGRRQVDEVGSCLGADGVHQHLLAGPARSRQQHGPDQRALHVHRRRPCIRGAHIKR